MSGNTNFTPYVLSCSGSGNSLARAIAADFYGEYSEIVKGAGTWASGTTVREVGTHLLPCVPPVHELSRWAD